MSAKVDVERFGVGLGDEELIRIIRAKQSEESVLPALKELIRRKSPARIEIYREILADPEQSKAARTTVVTALGTEGGQESQTLLVRQLQAGNAALFANVVQSLGRVGDGAALEILERTEPPDIPRAREALAFARSLLAYRLRIARHQFGLPAEGDFAKLGRPVKLRAGNAEEAAVRKALQEVELPGLPLARDGAAEIGCDGTTLLFVFTEEFSDPGSLGSLREKIALPFVLLKRGSALGRYFLDAYFLTQPFGEGGEVALLGTRPEGTLVYGGKAWRVEGGFGFILRSLKSRYVPAIEIEGRFDPERKSWEFDKAVTEPRGTEKRPAGVPGKVVPDFTTDEKDDRRREAQIIRRAMAFDLAKILFRYQKEEDLSAEVARQHERELKRFLALTAISRCGYGMRGPIDRLWHTFILFTKIYERFCREVAGRFIHHFPNISGFEPADEGRKSRILNLGPNDYLRFLKDYEATFGEPAPEQFWPRPSGREIGVYAAAECASDDCGNTCGADSGGTGGEG